MKEEQNKNSKISFIEFYRFLETVEFMFLNELKIGESTKLKNVGGEGVLRQHFLDMGLIPGVEVTLIKFAPMGDPMELMIHGYELTLRIDDAKKIEVEEPYLVDPKKNDYYHKKKLDHPGLGEGGKYHEKSSENPLPKGTVLSFALAGNQNCGKTTLFNQLTGSNQHVGNFPGVTVDKKSGEIKNYKDTLVTDLPGIYSLSPYSDEEIVSREFILNEKPKGIINIVDAMNIERNLYLSLQLMELEVPMVLALNMMDEVTGNGGEIDVNAMENYLGIPVVPISASKNEGVNELIDHALHIAQYQEKPVITDFCKEGSPIHRCIHGIMNLIEDHARDANIPVRFAACKVIEGDQLIIDRLHLTQNELDMLEHIILQMEEERGLDRSAAIADMRYDFIMDVCEKCVTKPHESKEHLRSKKIDKILTGKYTAIPAFILIMSLVFFLTFSVIGGSLQKLLEYGINQCTILVDKAFTSWGVDPSLHSLVINGIFKGVGSVLSFLPIIVTLFLFLSLLEDSGYMTRIAFVMDKLLRKIGLSGKSIVPMLVGFGCTVPGVMATRTLSSERDRKMTIMMTPFMSCSAKLPIYAFFASAFFGNKAWLVMVALYFLGIILGILVALISKKTMFKGEAVPFVMELPNYRLPSPKNTGMLLWDKAKDFLVRAFTIILISTIIIWFLETFNYKLVMVEHPEDSILASIAGVLAPIFKPLGLGDWRIPTSLVGGVIAKESVVSTLQILYSEELATQSIASILSVSSVAALLVFSLLYTPCVAAIATIKRELGRKWAMGIVLFQCALAYFVAFIVKMILILLGVN